MDEKETLIAFKNFLHKNDLEDSFDCDDGLCQFRNDSGNVTGKCLLNGHVHIFMSFFGTIVHFDAYLTHDALHSVSQVESGKVDIATAFMNMQSNLPSIPDMKILNALGLSQIYFNIK